MTCPRLHIPYKFWADDEHELMNYLSIERWADEIVKCSQSAGVSFTWSVKVYGETTPI